MHTRIESWNEQAKSSYLHGFAVLNKVDCFRSPSKKSWSKRAFVSYLLDCVPPSIFLFSLKIMKTTASFTYHWCVVFCVSFAYILNVSTVLLRTFVNVVEYQYIFFSCLHWNPVPYIWLCNLCSISIMSLFRLRLV